MWAILQRRHLEAKYLLLGACLIGALIALSQSAAFVGIERRISAGMQHLVEWGVLGVFLGALAANATLIISVPYTLLVLSVALAGDGWGYYAALSVAAGLGAGLGEIISYVITDHVARQIEALEESALFRWARDTLHRHPRSTPALVFVCAASVLPDDLVIMPLAVSGYPVRRILLPMFAGKILHSLSLIVLVMGAVGLDQERLGGGTRIDLSLGVLIACGLVIFYQIERARRGEEPGALAAS